MFAPERWGRCPEKSEWVLWDLECWFSSWDWWFPCRENREWWLLNEVKARKILWRFRPWLMPWWVVTPSWWWGLSGLAGRLLWRLWDPLWFWPDESSETCSRVLGSDAERWESDNESRSSEWSRSRVGIPSGSGAWGSCERAWGSRGVEYPEWALEGGKELKESCVSAPECGLTWCIHGLLTRTVEASGKYMLATRSLICAA